MTERTFCQQLLRKEKALEKHVTCEAVHCHSSLFEHEAIVSITQPPTVFLHMQVPVTLKSSILFKL